MFLAILLSNAYQKQELPQECWNIRASKSYSIRKGLDLDSADPTETICEQDAIEWSGLPKQYVNKMRTRCEQAGKQGRAKNDDTLRGSQGPKRQSKYKLPTASRSEAFHIPPAAETYPLRPPAYPLSAHMNLLSFASMDISRFGLLHDCAVYQCTISRYVASIEAVVTRNHGSGDLPARSLCKITLVRKFIRLVICEYQETTKSRYTLPPYVRDLGQSMKPPYRNILLWWNMKHETCEITV
ncbi:hypothetical protein Vi05172_g3819 [Venturia inaequalis]|nr:hypothetical protein Vi05172_g3819 [Venturia inaequalis]